MKKTIFVADFFIDEYVGGAELTTHALMKSCPNNAKKIKCNDLNVDFVVANKDCDWIICNFASLKDEIKLSLAKNCTYSIVEYDYKFCNFRSPELHQKTTGDNCDCTTQPKNKINLVFYGRAEKIWFMSREQQGIFFKECENN